MIQFSTQPKRPKTPIVYDKFHGVDFAKTPATTASSNSPNSVNMIRDEISKVRRRMGYKSIIEYGATDVIYGIHKLNDIFIIHVGTKLYRETYSGGAYNRIELYVFMAAHKSVSQQINNKLYILDGTSYICCDGLACAPVVGYIPTVMIACDMNGTGTAFEDYNLLTNKFRKLFEGGQEYYLSSADDTYFNTITVEHYADGAWAELPNTHSYPPVGGWVVKKDVGIYSHIYIDPLIDTGGQGTIRFTYTNASLSSKRDVIDKCDTLTMYGVNGQENQLFVTGSTHTTTVDGVVTKYNNRDYWSAVDDPTYFSDLSYSILGQDDSSIVGYSKINGLLATHKDTKAGSIYLRSGENVTVYDLIKSNFPVKSVLNGGGTIAKRSFQNIGEPLFLTKSGIQTISTQDLTNREYEQTRGDRVNIRLLTEPNIENAVSTVYKDYYLIAVNGNVYVLDKLQKQYEPNKATSEYQYVAFFWDNVPASCFYNDNDTLYFGTADGKIMQFYTDANDASSYNDNGSAIVASWEFPQFVGNLFWSNKTFTHFFLKLKSAVRTGAEIDVQIKGLWGTAKTDYVSYGYFDFGDIDFSNLNFSTDQTPKTEATKIKFKKINKIAFRLKNTELNQPFGIDSFGFLYTEKGINKGED